MNRIAKFAVSARRSHIAGLFAGVSLAVAILACGPISAELKGPEATDRQVTRLVTRMLSDDHLSKHPLDDEISKRAHSLFLKMLDPMKMYFTQADINEFAKYETKLDDMAKDRDLNFAYLVYSRLLKRIDERVALIDELLKGPIDFTVDEEILLDPKQATYPQTDAEVRDMWRKRVKYDLLVMKSDKIEEAEARQKLSRRHHGIARRRHQMKDHELIEMYLTALTSSYDPHSSYMSEATVTNFEIQMKLKLDGIGAALQQKLDDVYITVSKLIPGGAAEKDGRLKKDDKIIGVGQDRDGPIVDVVDMSLNEVVDLIRGKPGTIVRLKVIPAAGGEPRIYDLARASIELKDSEARAEVINLGEEITAESKTAGNDEEARGTILQGRVKPNGQPYKIGVIDLPSFYMDMAGARAGIPEYKSTTRDVRRILDDFNAKGVDAVILDLRRNGGGSLPEAVALTGLFIDEGCVVQVKDSDGRIQHYDDPEQGVVWSGPLVVLQSKFSASASEIFAGAIQDYRRGLVIGDRTSHGKGTVQSLVNLGQYLFRIGNAPSMGALKITIQQFYRPNGDSTQNRGVVSDVELPSLTTHLDVGEADLDHALAFDRISPASYEKANMVDQGMVEELRARSKQRVTASPDFQKAMKTIERYKQQKERKRVSLNESKFLAERAELNAEKEEENQFDQLDDPNRPVVKRDYYFNEALAVTLDYLELQHLASTRGVAAGRRAVARGQN
jgi:carboxyl-terminal processing protease